MGSTNRLELKEGNQHMESRLSEYTVKATFDAGHRSLPWQPGQPSGFLAGIDLDAILASPESKQIIQSLPVQTLYVGLKKRGFADSLEVLPLLSQDQVTRISDFDCWHKGRLAPKRMMELMGYFAEISDKQLYERFAFLDEEYQIATLQGLIQVIEEEDFELLPSDLQDQFNAMPCHKVFYRIKTDDPDSVAFIDKIIKSACEHNLRYAYSLLAHVAYDVPNEAEATIRRFRTARLEEDGFVPYEESLLIFRPVALKQYKEKWHIPSIRPGATATSNTYDVPFINLVLDKAQQAHWSIDEQYQVHLGLLTLTNAMCSAVNVEPDDTSGLVRILEQCQALVGFGIDFLSQGNLTTALEILKNEHPKTLFRVGLTLVNELRSAFLVNLKKMGVKQADALLNDFHGQRWGNICYQLDVEYLDLFGFDVVEILKGLFNRFPMAPVFSSNKESMQFRPLYSMMEFARLQEFVWAVMGLFYLKKLAGSHEEMGLEYAMTTILANMSIGKGLSSEGLSAAERENLMTKASLTRDGVLLEIKARLMLDGKKWHPDSYVEQTLERIMHILKGFQTGLMQACSSGKIPASMIRINEDLQH